MDLSINRREKQGVIILELNGRVVTGEECESFRHQIKELLASRQMSILLNLGEVTRIDSTGIGALVESVILAAKGGGRVKLFNVPRLVRNILSTHRLLQAFDVYTTEEEALASFAAEAPKAAD